MEERRLNWAGLRFQCYLKACYTLDHPIEHFFFVVSNAMQLHKWTSTCAMLIEASRQSYMIWTTKIALLYICQIAEPLFIPHFFSTFRNFAFCILSKCSNVDFFFLQVNMRFRRNTNGFSGGSHRYSLIEINIYVEYWICLVYMIGWNGNTG